MLDLNVVETWRDEGNTNGETGLPCNLHGRNNGDLISTVVKGCPENLGHWPFVDTQ